MKEEPTGVDGCSLITEFIGQGSPVVKIDGPTVSGESDGCTIITEFINQGSAVEVGRNPAPLAIGFSESQAKATAERVARLLAKAPADRVAAAVAAVGAALEAALEVPEVPPQDDLVKFVEGVRTELQSRPEQDQWRFLAAALAGVTVSNEPR